MKTVTIQIGNSDDKLTQKEWAGFIHHVETAIKHLATHIYYSGGSDYKKPWQNACWVIDIEDESLSYLKTWISKNKVRFKQDAIAWTEGVTELI